MSRAGGGAVQEFQRLDTVALNEEEDGVVIIDQTCLPGELRTLTLCDKKECYDAIYTLAVRGAPAIGVFAALSMYVLAKRTFSTDHPKSFQKDFEETRAYLNASRPTAVNLSWALSRMGEALSDALAAVSPEGEADWHRTVLERLRAEALSIYHEDIEVCRRIGTHGLTLLRPGAGVLTHCNAGRLATVCYGTATAPLYLAAEKGYHLRVYCDETRPLLQGARLTAYELSAAGIDTTVLCDHMSASIMQTGKIDAVFVGCDRVAANGDTANKIGTAALAVVSKYYGVPVYICAPTSTIDRSTPTGKEIVIEQRDPSEVTELWYEKRMAPAGVGVYNPAFDVTPAELITGIVTEYGILYPPYEDAIRTLFSKNGL